MDYIKTNWELRRVAASFSLFLWVSAQLTCLFTLSPAAHLAQQDPLPPAFKDSHSYLFLMNPTLTFCVSRSARVACVLLCGSKSESKAMRRTYQTDECVLCVLVGAEASSELAGSSLQPFLPKYFWAKLPDMISIRKPPQLCKCFPLSLSLSPGARPVK